MRYVALAMVLLGAGSVHGQTWAAIDKQYTKFAKAYVANDVTTMLAILTPEYSLTDENGRTIDFKTYRAQLEERRERSQVSSVYTVKILSLDKQGNTAVVGTKEITKGIGGVEHIHRYRDIWRYVNGVWRLSSTTTLGHN